MNKFVFTCGDINGIGPEVVIKTLNRITAERENKYYFIIPKNVFQYYSQFTQPSFEYKIFTKIKEEDPPFVSIIDAGKFKIESGKPTKESGKASFKAIKTAFDIVSKKKADAIITAPISKTAINKAGYRYPGHTEMFADWSGSDDFVMMFLSKKMKAALLTIHEPLKKVPSLITKKLLRSKIEIILNTLKNDLRIENPRCALLGLNPHAGEEGLIGKEEEKIIKPFLRSVPFKENISGPFSPDAFFANKLYEKFDLVIGMYHDQVLIPFKMLNFSSGVNYTAGLPIIRTSPDHGTAFEIAGKNIADESSTYEAFIYARTIVGNRNK